MRSGSHRGRASGELWWVGARERSCGAVPWWAPPPSYGTAPLLLREPTLYYARHSPGHTHACTATPLFDGNPGRECSPHYQMFARVAKLRVSQNLGGHHLDEGQLRELRIWALRRCCHPPLAKADNSGTQSWWHFLGDVSVLLHARLYLLGRMLGSCIQRCLRGTSTIRIARSHALPVTDCLCSPRTMS